MTCMKAEDPSEEWSRQLIGDREYKAMLKKEAQPDPFEEWWAKSMIILTTSHECGEAIEIATKQSAKRAWDAAVKHMEGRVR